MNIVVAEGNDDEDLTDTGTGTVNRHERLITDFTQNGREVVVSMAGLVVHTVNRSDDGASGGVVVEVEFDVTLISECHHTYSYLVWSNCESANDVD